MSNDTIEQELLDAYMVVTYGENRSAWPVKADLGYYYIPLRTTGGTTHGEDEKWIRYDISSKNQDGTLVYANTKNVAKEHSVFSYFIHYAPEYYIMGDAYGYIPKGVADAMRKYVAVGDSIRLIIPPSLLGSSSYFNATTNAGKPVVLDIALRNVVYLPGSEEENELLEYRNSNFPGAKLLKGESGSDTTNIYFQELAPPAENVAVETGDTVWVHYTGRYLDGYVFDTNIADSAKKHNIYTYNPSVFTAEGLQFIIGDDSMIDGFEAAVKNMKKGSSSVVMFTSEWGYGNLGKDNGGPNYASMAFHITLVNIGKAETDD